MFVLSFVCASVHLHRTQYRALSSVQISALILRECVQYECLFIPKVYVLSLSFLFACLLEFLHCLILFSSIVKGEKEKNGVFVYVCVCVYTYKYIYRICAFAVNEHSYELSVKFLVNVCWHQEITLFYDCHFNQNRLRLELQSFAQWVW